MPRRDGEDWLEGRPFGTGVDPAEREEARSHLRNWRWWALIVGAAVIIGIVGEGILTLLGGDFSLGDGLNTAIGASLGLIVSTWIVSRDDRR